MTDLEQQHINQISFNIIACAMKVHNVLGPGLLESVYEKAMMIELRKAGFSSPKPAKG